MLRVADRVEVRVSRGAVAQVMGKAEEKKSKHAEKAEKKEEPAPASAPAANESTEKAADEK